MHNYFYFYSTVSCIALCVHLIINWHQLADWRGARARAGALEFRLFVSCLSVYFLTDVLWGVFAGLKLPRALYFDTFVFFIAMALSVLAWTRFAVTYLLNAIIGFSELLEQGVADEDARARYISSIRSNARLAHLPAYLITADVEALGKAESNGATGILLKPITLDKLQALFT